MAKRQNTINISDGDQDFIMIEVPEGKKNYCIQAITDSDFNGTITIHDNLKS